MENEATTKTPIPPRPGFRNFALCTFIFALPNPLSVCLFAPSCLSGQDPRSTLVETPLQISLFSAEQSQFQNGQYKHKYSKNKGLCQRTTNNEQRTLFKTNPIKPNFPTPLEENKPNRTQFFPPPIFQNLPFRPRIYHVEFASPNFPESGNG